MTPIISIIFGILELTVGLRFLFRLFGANADAPLVSWVYDLSTPLIAPFAGIFGQSSIAASGVTHSVFEPSTLVALIVYGAIGGILIRLFGSH